MGGKRKLKNSYVKCDCGFQMAEKITPSCEAEPKILGRLTFLRTLTRLNSVLSVFSWVLRTHATCFKPNSGWESVVHFQGSSNGRLEVIGTL